jgi:hypothetical protein
MKFATIIFKLNFLWRYREDTILQSHQQCTHPCQNLSSMFDYTYLIECEVASYGGLDFHFPNN